MGASGGRRMSAVPAWRRAGQPIADPNGARPPDEAPARNQHPLVLAPANVPERREAVAGSVLCSGGATTGVMRSVFRFGGLDVMPLLVVQGSNVQAVRF